MQNVHKRGTVPKDLEACSADGQSVEEDTTNSTQQHTSGFVKMLAIAVCLVIAFSSGEHNQPSQLIDRAAVSSSLTKNLSPKSSPPPSPPQLLAFPPPKPTAATAAAAAAPPATSTSSLTTQISPYSHITSEAAEFSNVMAIKLTTKLLGGPTTHYEPNSIPCDDDGGDFQFHNWDKRMANVIILCEGVTTIECLLDSRDGLPHPGVTKKSPKTGNDPIVSFCYARNLYPPTSASAASCATDDFKERPGCEWTAYCKPVGDYARQGANPDALMMRGFGTHFSHFRSGNLKISNESGPLIAELSASEASEAGADDPNPKLYYMAHGDCGGAWNPGHCSADPLNLSVVQKLLGADRTNTVAYLMRGLNYDDLANTDGSPDRPLFKLWEALASRTYSRKTAYDNFPRGGKPVSLVAFSPSPASSIWWGGNQCKAVHLSAVWFNFRSR